LWQFFGDVVNVQPSSFALRCNHRFASLPCPVVLAASIDLHIDSREKFLCNASREHLVKLSNCSWQLWFWPKNRKTEVTLLIPEWGSELLSFKGLLCCFPFSLSPLCSVLFVCLFVFFLVSSIGFLHGLL